VLLRNETFEGALDRLVEVPCGLALRRYIHRTPSGLARGNVSLIVVHLHAGDRRSGLEHANIVPTTSTSRAFRFSDVQGNVFKID
jgi:hypothetical protein